jgi:hypothetical protein
MSKPVPLSLISKLSEPPVSASLKTAFEVGMALRHLYGTTGYRQTHISVGFATGATIFVVELLMGIGKGALHRHHRLEPSRAEHRYQCGDDVEHACSMSRAGLGWDFSCSSGFR